MKSNIADEAFAALDREATRVDDNKTRESIQKKIKDLRKVFGAAEKTTNPPGKNVIRDKNGKVVGLAG